MRWSAFAIMVVLLLSIVVTSYTESAGYGHECPAFNGLIEWGDSLEEIQSLFGRGSVHKYGDFFTALTYKNKKFANNDASYSLYFKYDKLSEVVIMVTDLHSDSEQLKTVFLSAFHELYGDYIMTNHESIHNESYEQCDDGDLYWWFIDEYSGVYIHIGSGIVSMNYVMLK